MSEQTEPRLTTAHFRYQVGLEMTDGAFDTQDWVQNLTRAMSIGARLYKDEPTATIFVYDRMARKGKPQLWHYESQNWIVKEYRK